MGTSYTNQSPHPDMTGYIGQDYFYGNKDTQPHTKVLPHSRKHYHCHSLRHDYSRCHWGCSLLPQLSKYHQHYFPADFLPTAHSVFFAAFALILLLIIPYIILSCLIPAPEQQMAQQIKDIQARLAQQEQQVEQLQRQIQDVPSPLLNLNEKQQKTVIEKLTLVA